MSVTAGADTGALNREPFLLGWCAAEAGFTAGYAIASEEKLRALAAEWRVADRGSPLREVALDLAHVMAAQFGAQEGPLEPALRAPEGQRARWEKLGITSRGVDREVVELLHRTHHGVEAEALR